MKTFRCAFLFSSVYLLVAFLICFPQAESLTVKETIRTDPRLSGTAQFVRRSKSLESFDPSDYNTKITIAVPSNKAWREESQQRINFLLDRRNRNELESLLFLSTLERPYTKAVALSGVTSVTTLLGVDAKVDPGQNSFCLLNPANRNPYACANVVTWDIMCDDGVIHIIDRVLYPVELLENPRFPN